MPSEVEQIKSASRHLRGTLEESLANPLTGALNPDDTHLIKFHGSYQQTDRGLDSERKRQKLEPLYSFMIRVRVPGGIATPQQWLIMDSLADQYGNGTIKLTTRQAFQLHGVLKRDLRATIQGFNAALLDSIAGCGDVNRNVMCNPNPHQSRVHALVCEDARLISAHLTPRTTAYHEIWLNGERLKEGMEDEEPIYGKTYLPRKFKIALAIPPHNDTDVFSNDIGIIAIERSGELLGYNIAVGGGLGMTFGMPETYPRLADFIGYVPRHRLLETVEAIVTIQRDWGNRENRKLSRLKYTIDRVGLDAFKTELGKRTGFRLLEPEFYRFESSGDAYGWSRNLDGTFNLTLFIEGGRIRDFRKGEASIGDEDYPGEASQKDYPLKTALRLVARVHDGDFRLTGNQNLMICRISQVNKPAIEGILSQYGIWPQIEKTGLRLNSIACVALNTCSQAFAEAERYLPSLIDRLDGLVREHGLEKADIIIRMTGCPNGCGRPYLGEIGLVGKTVGRYNLYLGAGFNGERLNKLYREMLDEDGIVGELRPLLAAYAAERRFEERFGDFVIRKGYIKATTHGTDFHH